MKLYILTKTVTSEEGGTMLEQPEIFASKEEAEKGMYDNINMEKYILNHELKEYIILKKYNNYQYTYNSKILGYTKIEYKIWEK